jgi:hypothetical protein
MDKNTVSKYNKVVKKNIDKAKIHTVEPVEKDNTDKNNKISCDQIKNMNESHKIKLKIVRTKILIFLTNSYVSVQILQLSNISYWLIKIHYL